MGGTGAPAVEDYCDCDLVIFSSKQVLVSLVFSFNLLELVHRAQKMNQMYLLSVFMRDQRSILLLECCIDVFLSIFNI